MQVQVRNLHVSLLIIRKTGVKIIQGHHQSQPGMAQLLDQITNAFLKKTATKKWQNAAIAMMDG